MPGVFEPVALIETVVLTRPAYLSHLAVEISVRSRSLRNDSKIGNDKGKG
jgi:hypothetical protein